MCTNVRAAFSKIESITSEIKEESIDAAFLTEMWLDSSNPLHSNRLERLFELEGLQTIATPRRGRRGGGVAIVLNTAGNFEMKKLHVNVACVKNSIETVWALLTPKTPGGPFKQYICCCLYSPPNSKLNETLLHHIQFNITRLTDLYRSSGVIICGDINNLKIDRLENIYADIKNLVADPTHGKRILDVILTNAHKHYD